MVPSQRTPNEVRQTICTLYGTPANRRCRGPGLLGGFEQVGSEYSGCCRMSDGLVLAHRSYDLAAAPHTIRQGPSCAGLGLIQQRRHSSSLICELLGTRPRLSAQGPGKAQDTVLTATFKLRRVGRVPFPSVPKYAHREKGNLPSPFYRPHEEL